MIAFLEGVIEVRQPTHVVLNIGGVGYEVLIPLSSFDRLPREGERCRLLIHDLPREEEHLLIGFATEDERLLFRRLLAVSGIGPKTALSALSGLSTRELKLAIAQGDVKRLASITGIGRKTAERIVVELRDKISPAEALEAATGAPSAEDVKRRDAVLALISLGYKQSEALRMVASAVPEAVEGLTVEDIVRRALTAGRAGSS